MVPHVGNRIAIRRSSKATAIFEKLRYFGYRLTSLACMVFVRSRFIDNEFIKSFEEHALLLCDPFDSVDVGDVDVGVGFERGGTIRGVRDLDT